MSSLELIDVVDERLGPLTLRVKGGAHVLLSADAGALERAVEIASGARRPQRGRALLGPHELGTTPSARRRVASLLAQEELLPASDVATALALHAEAASTTLDARALLESVGLARLSAIEPSRVSAADRRAIALAFALAASGAEALVLYEPLALAPYFGRQRIIAACAARAADRPVVIATCSVSDAVAFGDAATVLLDGQPIAHSAFTDAAPPVELVVRTPRAAELCERLREKRVDVSFDRERSDRELFVRGPDLAALGHAVCETAARHAIGIDALRPLYPSLEHMTRSPRSAPLAATRSTVPPGAP